MDDRQLRHVFGWKTAVEITRMRGFVEVWKREKLHKFEIPGYFTGMSGKIAAATGYKPDAKLAVFWNADAADLYTLDGRFICTCLPAKKAVQAKAESNKDTDYAIGHHEKRQRIQVERADQFEKAAVETAAVLQVGAIDGYNIAITDKNYSKEDYNAGMEKVTGNAPKITNDFDSEHENDSLDTENNDFDYGADNALDDL